MSCQTLLLFSLVSPLSCLQAHQVLCHMICFLFLNSSQRGFIAALPARSAATTTKTRASVLSRVLTVAAIALLGLGLVAVAMYSGESPPSDPPRVSAPSASASRATRAESYL